MKHQSATQRTVTVITSEQMKNGKLLSLEGDTEAQYEAGLAQTVASFADHR